MIRKRCPKCGKKTFIKGNKFVKKATNRCYSCDMEFYLKKRKGVIVWSGQIPTFTANE